MTRFLLLILLQSCGTPRRLYYFDSVRLFPEDSLEAAVNFGKANFQKAVYRLSTGEDILLNTDSVKPRLEVR